MRGGFTPSFLNSPFQPTVVRVVKISGLERGRGEVRPTTKCKQNRYDRQLS